MITTYYSLIHTQTYPGNPKLMLCHAMLCYAMLCHAMPCLSPVPNTLPSLLAYHPTFLSYSYDTVLYLSNLYPYLTEIRIRNPLTLS